MRDTHSVTKIELGSTSPRNLLEHPEQFKPMTTPYDYGYDLPDGALREGGRPDLFTKKYIGLLFQYAAVGLIDGVLPSTIYPFMTIYLNVSGVTSATASTLVTLPWSFKVFYGMLSDCLPLYGYRRRPYMILGWLITFLMLLAMGLTPQGKPYFTDPKYRDILEKDYTPEIWATINTDAATSGGIYVILMMLCAFGYMLADVCADGFIVELAQREPLAVRGTTQATIYGVRTVFNIVALVINAFAFNGAEYGGDFVFSLSFPSLMLILAASLLPVVPITWYFIHEEQYPRVDFRKYIDVLWHAIQMRAVYQVIAYFFLNGVFWRYSYTSLLPIQDAWAHVTPLNEKITAVVSNIVYAAAIWYTSSYGLHWNWRLIPFVTGVAVILLDSVVTMFTVWDVYRNQWFWLGIPVLETLPSGMSFIVSSFVCVELAVIGHEGAMYGLLTTVANLSLPFANSMTLLINSSWDLRNDRLQEDSHEVRRDVTYTIWLMYAFNLASLGWLFLLPRQKEETQMLKRIGGSSYLMGVVTVSYLTLAFAWSVVTNIMAIFPATSCLTIAGGTGCGDST